jgi:nitrite reductase (NADH) large subunit
MTFRDLGDVAPMAAAGRRARNVVIIGGGLLGLEAAYGLARAGAKVSLVHLMDRLMERQLDAPAAALLKRLVEMKGVEVVLGANTKQILGDSGVEGVELADGRTIDTDAVVFAAGIRPNATLAKDAGVPVNRGIVVDDQLRTGSPGIYALGECAEHRGTCYGLVEPAYEQARVLADHLADGATDYSGSVVATNLKVSGVSVFSAGDFLAAADSETLVFNDERRGTYKKLVVADGCLKGAVLVGDTQDALWYLDLIRTTASIEAIRGDIMFGRALAQPDPSRSKAA